MTYTTYTATGPFTNGTSPGIAAAFLNNIETMLLAGWFDSSITSNGSGRLTTLGYVCNGPLLLQMPGSAQALSNGNGVTLTHPIVKVTNSGAVTGIIMTAGSTSGDTILFYNSGTGSVTFAASGTSHVSGGSGTVVNVGHALWLMWDNSAALWIPCAG